MLLQSAVEQRDLSGDYAASDSFLNKWRDRHLFPDSRKNVVAKIDIYLDDAAPRTAAKVL